jgi:predicted transcriptional regulator
MIPPELSNIRRMRKKLGLSQTELAKLSKVSQSLIARIESDEVDPGYKKVTGIFRTLSSLQQKEVTARELMTVNIIGASKDKKIGEITKIMMEKGISQVPVFDRERVVGSISEETINELISKGRDPHEVYGTRVSQLMEESFPMVSPETQMSVISRLLEANKAVLVIEKGKPAGIITKTNLLKAIK